MSARERHSIDQRLSMLKITFTSPTDVLRYSPTALHQAESSGFFYSETDFSKPRVFFALSEEVIKTTCWHNEIREAIYWIINQICSTFRPQVRKEHYRKSAMFSLKCTRCLQALQNRDMKIDDLRNMFWWSWGGRASALHLAILSHHTREADRFNSYKHMAPCLLWAFFWGLLQFSLT